jgi:hypothetical protein
MYKSVRARGKGGRAVRERALLEAIDTMLYGHMDHEGEEVAIGERAWSEATEVVAPHYPDLAAIMRRVQEKAYVGSPEAERRLEDDFGAFCDAHDLYPEIRAEAESSRTEK